MYMLINLVNQFWGERLSGDPLFVPMKKLQWLKVAIKLWRKDNLGGLTTQIETSEAELADLQAQLDENYLDSLMREASSKQCSFNGLLNLEDSIWKQKAKASWLVSGERNTKYFHALHRIKTKQSLITEVALDNGHMELIYQICANTGMYNSKDELLEKDVELSSTRVPHGEGQYWNPHPGRTSLQRLLEPEILGVPSQQFHWDISIHFEVGESTQLEILISIDTRDCTILTRRELFPVEGEFETFDFPVSPLRLNPSPISLFTPFSVPPQSLEMGDANDNKNGQGPMRIPFKDHMFPKMTNRASCIVLPPTTGQFELRNALINSLPKLLGGEDENPYAHVRDFDDLMFLQKYRNVNEIEAMKLVLLPFSLLWKAKSWLQALRPKSITRRNNSNDYSGRPYYQGSNSNQNQGGVSFTPNHQPFQQNTPYVPPQNRKPSSDDGIQALLQSNNQLMQQFMQMNQQSMSRIKISIAQLASGLSTRDKCTFPSQTQPNPKDQTESLYLDQANAVIVLRSGMTVDNKVRMPEDKSRESPNPSTEKVVEGGKPICEETHFVEEETGQVSLSHMELIYQICANTGMYSSKDELLEKDVELSNTRVPHGEVTILEDNSWRLQIYVHSWHRVQESIIGVSWCKSCKHLEHFILNDSVFEGIPVRPYDIKCKISAAVKDAAAAGLAGRSPEFPEENIPFGELRRFGSREAVEMVFLP
ncbi:hypothetical protein GIB67_018581 [Kingdonia uniflora]|uniref:Uncharacterized protein n=1 Tax=Kingdonia uniflora TaxID=39325 RepID=A0A7J7L8H3_9MAGN|nr:hypothetical protein GIB67_018581 [Kingdonia uniflora]